MLHAILLLVATGQLMLFNDTVHVVIHVGTNNETVLRLTVHCLGIDIIVLLVVLYKPAHILKLLEVLGCLVIDTWVVFVSSYGEVNLGFDDMVKRLFVVAGFGACLFGVEHVIRTALHLLHQCLWRTYAFEWFDYGHNLSVLRNTETQRHRVFPF